MADSGRGQDDGRRGRRPDILDGQDDGRRGRRPDILDGQDDGRRGRANLAWVAASAALGNYAGGCTMTDACVSFAGNLTDNPEVRHTESGIARARFRVAVSGRREQEASYFTVIAWRDQADHATQSLSKGSRVVVVGRLRQRSWTAEDGSARSVVEVVAEELGEELGPSLRWATATTTRATHSSER